MTNISITRFSTLLTFFILIIGKTYAIETITINKGNIAPIPIAINNFDSKSEEEYLISSKITEVINNDLANSGIFKTTKAGAFIENKRGINYIPNFASWRQINVVCLVNGQVTKKHNGKFTTTIVLWDTITGKELFGNVFNASINNWRRVAHQISDKIYEKIIGEQGYFDTNIAYVAEELNPKARKNENIVTKRIAIMDLDGENHRYITDNRSLVLTPRFSPKGDKILYVSYAKGKKGQVLFKDLKTGRETIVGHFPNMTVSPRFSLDGQKAIMSSVAQDGSANIVEIDLYTNQTKKLTNNFAINISPTYSPDSSKIYFSSDISGGAQLYSMDFNGDNVIRISFGEGVYHAPVCSPKGDYIAFIKQSSKGMMLGIMRPDGTEERTISQGYIVDNPTWSPNGRKIIFTKKERPFNNKEGASYIYQIDTIGYSETRIPTPKEASNPEWSKPLE